MSYIAPLNEAAILAAAANLPPAPQIMARLYKLLLDCNSGLRGIGELLKLDQALTLRVVRIANSPAYGGNNLGNIEDALARVGFGEVYRLVGIASNEDLGKEGMRCYGFGAQAFQKHNLFSAFVAERLAVTTGQDERSAYSAGLLRRIGQLLLDQIGAKSLAPYETFTECGAGRAEEWERRTFGITHYEVGGILLAKWGFPEDIVSAVQHVHGSGGEMNPFTRLLDLADNLVRLAGLGLTQDEAEWGVPAEKLSALGIDHATAIEAKDDALCRLQDFERGLVAA